MLALGFALIVSAATNVHTVVMLAPRSSERPASEAADVIKSHLSDTDTVLEVAWVDDFDVGSERAFRLAEDMASQRHADVVFWTDYKNPRVLLWYWRDGPVARLFVQSLGDDGTSRRARLEALGLAVHSATASTSIGVGATAHEVTPTSPSEPPAPPPALVETVKADTIIRAPHRLRLGVAIGGTTFASEAHVARIIDVLVGLRLTSGLDAVLIARWMIPPDIASDYGKLTLRTYSARLGLQHTWDLGDVGLSLGGAAAVGYRGWSFSGVSNVQQAGDARALVGIAPFASAGYRLSERLRAALTVGADIWLNEKRYGVATTSANQVIAQPWWVAPWVQLAATVDFL